MCLGQLKRVKQWGSLMAVFFLNVPFLSQADSAFSQVQDSPMPSPVSGLYRNRGDVSTSTLSQGKLPKWVFPVLLPPRLGKFPLSSSPTLLVSTSPSFGSGGFQMPRTLVWLSLITGSAHLDDPSSLLSSPQGRMLFYLTHLENFREPSFFPI